MQSETLKTYAGRALTAADLPVDSAMVWQMTALLRKGFPLRIGAEVSARRSVQYAKPSSTCAISAEACTCADHLPLGIFQTLQRGVTQGNHQADAATPSNPEEEKT